MAATIADRLRQARINKKFETAKEAADAYGWNYGTYRSHENGTREPPKHMLLTYAAHFGVSVSWLLRGVEDRVQARGTDGHPIPIVDWKDLPQRRAQMSGVISKSRSGQSFCQHSLEVLIHLQLLCRITR